MMESNVKFNDKNKFFLLIVDKKYNFVEKKIIYGYNLEQLKDNIVGISYIVSAYYSNLNGMIYYEDYHLERDSNIKKVLKNRIFDDETKCNMKLKQYQYEFSEERKQILSDSKSFIKRNGGNLINEELLFQANSEHWRFN